MRKGFCIALCILIGSAGMAQQDSIRFPVIFAGSWKGKLEWRVPGKTTQEFTMRLNVAPADSTGIYSWEISYGDSSKDFRPYKLKPVDTGKGHWVIDEGNGIALDNYVAGSCLQGSFTVMGNTIVNNYCIENGKLKVEFFTIKLADKKTTGKGTDESPVVDSYRMAGYQYGMLEKVN